MNNFQPKENWTVGEKRMALNFSHAFLPKMAYITNRLDLGMFPMCCTNVSRILRRIKKIIIYNVLHLKYARCSQFLISIEVLDSEKYIFS